MAKKKRTAPTPLVDSVSGAGERLCWTALRSLLTAYSEQKLREFAAVHKNETFYCLCVYFDIFYGDFLLYLNVPEQARQTAIRSKELYPDLHRQRTVEEVEEDLKWNCGDFRYEYINDDSFASDDSAWKRLWRPIQDLFNDLSMQLYGDGSDSRLDREWGEKWAETACAVALDLERGDALKLLRKTPDFQVICVDHDEPIEDSNARLDRVRQRYFPLGRKKSEIDRKVRKKKDLKSS